MLRKRLEQRYLAGTTMAYSRTTERQRKTAAPSLPSLRPLALLVAAYCGLMSTSTACGRTELWVPPLRECGDGVIDEDLGELCDLGADNEDRYAIVLIHDGVTTPVMPIDRAESSSAFYDYGSESSHTGFERVNLSALFLYRDSGSERLTLFTHHGVDEDVDGITLDHGLLDMDFEGLPDGATVLLADEPDDEVAMVGPNTAQGRWEFWRNSDGAILGPLPFPGSWTITVSIDLLDGINRWAFFTEDADPRPLDPTRVAILKAYATPSECRTDCTIPRCGDGIVDGGEVCDDANNTANDGCAADCSSL